MASNVEEHSHGTRQTTPNLDVILVPPGQTCNYVRVKEDHPRAVNVLARAVMTLKKCYLCS